MVEIRFLEYTMWSTSETKQNSSFKRISLSFGRKVLKICYFFLFHNSYNTNENKERTCKSQKLQARNQCTRKTSGEMQIKHLLFHTFQWPLLDLKFKNQILKMAHKSLQDLTATYFSSNPSCTIFFLSH